jgi:hypothetical protein
MRLSYVDVFQENVLVTWWDGMEIITMYKLPTTVDILHGVICKLLYVRKQRCEL